MNNELVDWPIEFPEPKEIAGYWGRDVLHSESESGAAVMSIGDLVALLTDGRARAPHLSVFEGGRPVDQRRYTATRNIGGSLGTGFLHLADLRALLAGGASLKLSALHDYWPAADRLRRLVQARTGLSTAVAAILSPPGQGAFVLHQDVEHVFVLQTYGSKRWQIYQPFPGQSMVGSVRRPEDATPAHDLTLTAGDFLYVPSAWPHVATCTDEWSLHVTTSVRPTLAAEVIRPRVNALLAELAMREVSTSPFDDNAPNPAEAVQTIAADVAHKLTRTSWQVDPVPPVPASQEPEALTTLFGA